ncbi:nicotinate phosphoribosyltransferase [Spirochaetia bacterium]|nr:nicotinate phosphoribosyltransferase [Spirochaetia bacterium]
MNSTLIDFYSLTMAQGYWKRHMDQKVVFEMFFRKQPYNGGFSIFAGLEPLLNSLQHFSFSPDDLEYLSGLGIFEEAFLSFLAGFRFTGAIFALDEGTMIFPNEPLIRIEGTLVESQLVEGMLLNTINFQTLIATKAARVWLASGKGTVMEFGLRRAQGADGALSASRAAYIGGAAGTSHVLAGKTFGIPVMGTMAHAWVMAFPTEEEAFHAYVDIYPKNPVFLIDTFNTLKSGAPNAIKIGKMLAEKGINFGVRLDSGDIHYLSVEVRKMLDAAGLTKATISVSNDLDELIIAALRAEGSPINVWGVGTKMVTGGGDSAFTGVYKLVMRDSGLGRLVPVMKLSDNPEKTTLPASKQVWRVRDSSGMAVADVLGIDDPEHSDILEKGKTYTFWHTAGDYRHFQHTIEGDAIPLLKLRLESGKLTEEHPRLEEIRGKVRTELESFDGSYQRLLNPHTYKVSLTDQMKNLKLALVEKQFQDFP